MEKCKTITVHMSPRAYKPLIKQLTNAGFRLQFSERLKNTDPAIADHPDLVLCDLIDTFYHGDASKLSPAYPGDIRYNAACTGRYFLHHLQYTDPELLQIVYDLNLIPVQVKQGYTKCNTLVADSDSIITSDMGIAKAFEKAGGTALLIRPGYIKLPGYEYGFIGGASGTCFRKTDTKGLVCFNGDLSTHPDCKEIRAFLHERKFEILDVPGEPLLDIGSVLFENTFVL